MWTTAQEPSPTTWASPVFAPFRWRDPASPRSWVTGPVEVAPMPNIHCLAIVMRSALGGGATTTLRYDQTGKAMGCALLRMEGEAPEALVNEAQDRARRIEGREP